MKRRIIIIGPHKHGGITAVVENLMKGGLNKYKNVIFHPSVYENHKFKSIYQSFFQYFVAVRLFIKFRPEIVHIHVSTQGSLYRKSFYIILTKVIKKKLIIHIHPHHFKNFISSSSIIKKNYILRIISMANLVITLTDELKNYLKTYSLLQKQNFIVMSNPIFLDDYLCKEEKNNENSTLLYLGWIVKNKGVYDLLKAAPLVKKEIDNFEIIYHGNKEVNKLKGLIKKYGLTDYVKVYGWIDLKKKKKIFKQINALILPSYTEGIPNVILEAMATGTPIITTPVGGIPEILTKNENCVFFDPGNIQDMAIKIVYLLKNKGLQKYMINNNYEKIKKYDAKHTVNKLLKVYMNL